MAAVGNDNLRPLGAKIKLTPQQLQELYKCAVDIEHFAENYCTIVTLDAGKQLIKLRQYQKDLLRALLGENVTNDKYNTIVLAPRQSGKCLTGDTLISVRNKLTGEILETTIEDFHNMFNQ